jgi:hypothetical protein
MRDSGHVSRFTFRAFPLNSKRTNFVQAVLSKLMKGGSRQGVKLKVDGGSGESSHQVKAKLTTVKKDSGAKLAGPALLDLTWNQTA